MLDAVKVIREIKGDDTDIVIRVKKLGEYVKKIDHCYCGTVVDPVGRKLSFIFSHWIFTLKEKK